MVAILIIQLKTFSYQTLNFINFSKNNKAVPLELNIGTGLIKDRHNFIDLI